MGEEHLERQRAQPFNGALSGIVPPPKKTKKELKREKVEGMWVIKMYKSGG